jgi:2,6-dihydroxypyridine 3-monooxygenase
MEIAVVGGSLGGLTAACLLADAGHDVTVYERSAARLQERGAGIGFLPMTAKYLAERGCVDLDQISVNTGCIRTLRRDGSVAHERPHRYRFSSWNRVYSELISRFDADRYLLGHDLIGLEPSTPELRFSNGTTITPDLAVCADGINSTARSVLQPGLSPRYAGYVAWRGVVPEEQLSSATRASLDDAITYGVTANSHVLVYPIPGRDGSVIPGERLINVVWYRNYAEGDDINDLLLDTNGEQRSGSVPPGYLRPEHVAEAKAVAAARLPGCINEVIAAIEQPFIQVIADLAVDRMVFDRTVLMGDAAFGVRPHAAAGTAKAAADAWALADAVAESTRTGDVISALKNWERSQLDLGSALLQRTRTIGHRSQVDSTWDPADPDLIFGLYGPGN